MSAAHFEKRDFTSSKNILFIHGNLASKYWWYPALEILEATFKNEIGDRTGSLYLGELRGCGRSPLPDDKNILLDDLVNDFINYTLSQNLKHVFIVGHSAGGLITALLLARRPDLFKGALMVDPVGPMGLQNVPEDIAEKYKAMENQPELAAQIISATIFGNDPENAFFKEKIMPDAIQSLKTAGVQLIKALNGVDYSQEVSTITQPVKLFYGAHDWVLDASHVEKYKILLRNSTYEYLPNNGHCMIYESPERLAIEIIQFLRLHT